MQGKTLVDVGLASLPDIPSTGKWTKLTGILSYLLFGHCCSGFLGPAMAASVSETKTQEEVQGDLDPQLSASVNWAAINGKRARSALRITGTPATCYTVCVLAVVQEGTRFLTHWHLSRSSGVRPRKQAPPLLDYANPEYSPVVCVLQYYASLLFDDGGRVLLLAGEMSVPEWEERNPGQIREFRRMVLLASAWVARRLAWVYSKSPYSSCATRIT